MFNSTQTDYLFNAGETIYQIMHINSILKHFPYIEK